MPSLTERCFGDAQPFVGQSFATKKEFSFKLDKPALARHRSVYARASIARAWAMSVLMGETKAHGVTLGGNEATPCAQEFEPKTRFVG